MSEPIIATRIAERAETADPFGSLRNAIAFSSADWGAARDLAWVYGIVLGWDDNDEAEYGAMEVLAARFGWSDETVARLRNLHAEFDRRAAASVPLPEDGTE